MSRLIIILLLVIVGPGVYTEAADSSTMPIIAYMGIPNDKTEDRFFKDFSDCGFNVSLYGYASLQQLTDACNTARKHGVRILGHCPETHNTPEQAAARLKDNPGFFGYVLEDEPSIDRIAQLQKEIVRLKKVDDTHCFYINLHAYYAEWTLLHTKSKTYEEYVDAALATSCRQLSFDYYPLTHDGMRTTWYWNLELMRRKSMQAGIPFWGFVLSVPHAIYPQPTMGSLRVQAYSNLAYGAQAIQYFTYWTPQPEKENDFHDGPVDQQGRKTKTYALVKNMNRELRPIADLFYGAQVLSVGHLGKIPQGASRQATMPANLSALKINGAKGALISTFKKAEHTYLAIVNKDHAGKMVVTVNARNDIPRHLTSDLSEERMHQTYQVQEGDILLFKLS